VGLEQLFCKFTGGWWGWNNCFVNLQEIGEAGTTVCKLTGDWWGRNNCFINLQEISGAGTAV
jgi:hypothetical protein